jgi:hypothetical protein
MDQPGRGKGDQLEGNFSTVCDETAGCPNYTGKWPNQASEPVYAWANTYDSSMTSYWQSSADAKPVMANNRDYYFPCGSNNSSCSSFTGAYGSGAAHWRPSLLRAPRVSDIGRLTKVPGTAAGMDSEMESSTCVRRQIPGPPITPPTPTRTHWLEVQPYPRRPGPGPPGSAVSDKPLFLNDLC